MLNCETIDPLVTPYVDGQLAAGDRVSVAGCGHNSLLYHPRVVAEVVERIMRIQAAATVRDARVAG